MAEIEHGVDIDRDIHPAEIGLFVAAALRGFTLTDSSCGQAYRVGHGPSMIYTAATFKDVVNLCGATAGLTLRETAERDGLKWPASAEAFLATIKAL